MSEGSSEERRAYERRLQRRLRILTDQFEAGKVRIAKGLQVVESLKKVQTLPDGTVDLSTVDGLVRSLALAVEAEYDRGEMKKSASLAEIQTLYFQVLEQNFGEFYKVMVERRLTPHDAGVALSQSNSTVATLVKGLPEFLAALDEFWTSVGPAAIAHVEDLHVLKAVFGGDLFPSAQQNIASKCGLYTDTLILPDPYLRSKHIFTMLPDEKKAYYLIKHGLNLLQYRELACADIFPPVVVVLPDLHMLDEDETRYFFDLARDDALVHAGKIFGRKFASFEELIAFANHLDTVERAMAEIRDPSRLLFDTDWSGSAADQLKRALSDPSTSGFMGNQVAGQLIAAHTIGRMSTSIELLVKSSRLRGAPIIDAPTSWQYLVWKLEYDSQQAEIADGLKDLHVVRGLQTLAAGDMRWLGNVPSEALIEVRKANALGEVRAILSKGIEELTAANPMNFHRTSDLVFDNIQSAFSEHQKNIDALAAKKWKFAGTDIGSWLVVGSLAAAAAATGTPVWGLAALAADQLLDAPKLHEIPASIKALAAESAKLKRSPVGMLFRLSKQ